ncbi:MAG: transcription antitermination factor NusB, partial [Bacillota bacterium]|nr:transcription antitermination factor NusB [Bacillota bacterium]
KIDRVISQYAIDWHLDRMANIDRNILRLAVYELLFLPDVPASVSVNEAVELAKKYGDVNSPRFINGILGNVVRQETLHKL